MGMFVCPLCGGALSDTAPVRRCPAGHCFDRAKEGYVNLLLSQKSKEAHHGDDKRMVAARRRFLDKGHYRCLQQAVVDAAREYAVPKARVLDAGCGEGYYTAAVDAALTEAGLAPAVAGVDISKEAVKQAGRRDRALELAVASVFRLPVADGGADLVLSLFAPKAEAEWHRVLSADGVVIRAVPLTRHLFELKAAVYDHPYENPPEDPAMVGFALVAQHTVEHTLSLDSTEDITDLFSMTPYYYKTGAADQQKLTALSRLDVTLSFGVWVYRRIP